MNNTQEWSQEFPNYILTQKFSNLSSMQMKQVYSLTPNFQCFKQCSQILVRNGWFSIIVMNIYVFEKVGNPISKYINVAKLQLFFLRVFPSMTHTPGRERLTLQTLN